MYLNIMDLQTSVQDGEKVYILSQKSGGFLFPFKFYGNFLHR